MRDPTSFYRDGFRENSRERRMTEHLGPDRYEDWVAFSQAEHNRMARQANENRLAEILGPDRYAKVLEERVGGVADADLSDLEEREFALELTNHHNRRLIQESFRLSNERLEITLTPLQIVQRD